MTVHSHNHPMSEGRVFNHTHDVHPDHLEQHGAQAFALAHPDMAEAAETPEPGSPADYRRAAAELRERAARFRDQADRCERTAGELEAQAARDEAEPPSTSERLRRLFD